MPEALKILAQTSPASINTDANLYTVPAATQTVVSSIVIANVTGAAATFRLHALAGAGASAAGNALFYDVSVGPKASTVLQIGIALAAGSRLVVQASVAGALTFTAFGQEVS